MRGRAAGSRSCSRTHSLVFVGSPLSLDALLCPCPDANMCRQPPAPLRPMDRTRTGKRLELGLGTAPPGPIKPSGRSQDESSWRSRPGQANGFPGKPRARRTWTGRTWALRGEQRNGCTGNGGRRWHNGARQLSQKARGHKSGKWLIWGLVSDLGVFFFFLVPLSNWPMGLGILRLQMQPCIQTAARSSTWQELPAGKFHLQGQRKNWKVDVGPLFALQSAGQPSTTHAAAHRFRPGAQML